MDKRGLSAVVATLLIVLITIAAVLLVWNVVKKNLESGASQLSKADCLKVDLKIDSCTKEGKYVLTYLGGNVSKLVVTTESPAGNNISILTGNNLPSVGSKITVTSNPALTGATKSSVTAFLIGSDGTEISCGIIDEKTCS